MREYPCWVQKWSSGSDTTGHLLYAQEKVRYIFADITGDTIRAVDILTEWLAWRSKRDTAWCRAVSWEAVRQYNNRYWGKVDETPKTLRPVMGPRRWEWRPRCA